jgi:hypothetical protein
MAEDRRTISGYPFRSSLTAAPFRGQRSAAHRPRRRLLRRAKNAGTRCKRNTRNTARASCAASPLVLKPQRPNNINSARRGPTDEVERAPAPVPVPAPTAKPPQPPQSNPSGCVLFARHVPLDANKAALHACFSALLADADTLDYVD